MAVYDLVIKNGRVIDGLGECVPFRPWRELDIAIQGGRIASLRQSITARAKMEIDAEGLIVAPGFIDIHSHSDIYSTMGTGAESKIRQGVTTEVVGNCGISAAPLNPFEAPRSVHFFDTRWDSMQKYLGLLEDKGILTNVVPLVGHCNIRARVLGYDLRVPTRAEMDSMIRLLREALKQGAWGMSSGLIYPPSSFANTDELKQLCRELKEAGAVYVTHMRGGGDRVLAATLESLEISKETQVPLHIAHHKGMGDRNAPKVLLTLPRIEALIAEGLSITLDMYPYLAGQGELAMFLPPWAQEGGPAKLVERLKNRTLRTKIKWEMIEPSSPGWESYAAELGWRTCWSKVIICDCKSAQNKSLIGMSIEEARPQGQDVFEFVFDLLIAEGGRVPVIIPDVINFEDEYLQVVLRHPITMVGSDGSALDKGERIAPGHPHPRNYGTFPRFLGTYVREKRLVTLPEAIRKLTSGPAEFLGLKDRGRIEEGLAADITIFDPDRISDRATFTNPRLFPTGIEYVIVNGTIVLERGLYTGALPGKILRKGGESR